MLLLYIYVNIIELYKQTRTNLNKKTPTTLKRILGISAFYHDSAAAITVGGKIIAAAQE